MYYPDHIANLIEIIKAYKECLGFFKLLSQHEDLSKLNNIKALEDEFNKSLGDDKVSRSKGEFKHKLTIDDANKSVSCHFFLNESSIFEVESHGFDDEKMIKEYFQMGIFDLIPVDVLMDLLEIKLKIIIPLVEKTREAMSDLTRKDVDPTEVSTDFEDVDQDFDHDCEDYVYDINLTAEQDKLAEALLNYEVIDKNRRLFTADYIDNAARKWMEAVDDVDRGLVNYYLNFPDALEAYLKKEMNITDFSNIESLEAYAHDPYRTCHATFSGYLDSISDPS